MSDSVLLSTAYFPPIQYFAQFVSGKKVILEKFEHFEKQSYRNRCKILTANGAMSLSVPVQRGSKSELIIDTRIDNNENWQQIHLRAINSAYGSSPFHEYYFDAFLPFFEKKFDFLFDFNTQILETLLHEIEVPQEINFTVSFEKEPNAIDFRYSIHPKNPFVAPNVELKNYTQVFKEKYGFVTDLSILDLLFNEGPNTAFFLENSFKKCEI